MYKTYFSLNEPYQNVKSGETKEKAKNKYQMKEIKYKSVYDKSNF